MIKFILSFLVGLLILVVLLIILRKLTWPPRPYDTIEVAQDEIPTFKEIKIDFTHHFDKTKSLPFMGAAVFDMDGSGSQYLFVGGGYNQPDELFVFNNNTFVNITKKSSLSKNPHDTTYCVAAVDVNNDGYIDLFIGRESGIYLYTNNKGVFTGKKLNVQLDPKYAPLSIAVADLQKKGLADIFVSAYLKVPHVEGQTIFNKEGYGAKSLLLKNNGDNTFTDITKEAGLDYVHNTFTAAFVDLDDDGNLDLVVAHDTGTVRTYKNLGNLQFKMMPNPTTDLFSYPMGIAVGDYNGNGKPDLFFTNVGPNYWWNIGSNPPEFIVRGDLRKDQFLLTKGILLKNEGNFTFTNRADTAKVADYGFGWGTLFQDFNHNGSPDLVLAQNYVDFPPHKLFKLPCRLLLNQSDGTFVPVEKKAGVTNPYYAISPLISDFSGNGFPDLVYTNLGGPLRVFINQGTNNNFIKLIMKNVPSSIGAKIIVTLDTGKIITSFYIPAQGLCSSQTNAMMIGIGKETKISVVKVYFMNGRSKTYEQPKINSTIQVE